MEGDDLIPLSALQHYLYCARQCALIHVERLWAENRFTAEGAVLHERVNAAGAETRGSLRTLRGLDIVSHTLGVSGKADVVEVRGAGEGARYCPVEYKRGKPKTHRADEVQLCAQAVCLEEIFGVSVPEGALYYGERRRRTIVAFDSDLRALTQRIASETRALLKAGVTPLPAYQARKCGACSLIDQCQPKAVEKAPAIARWIENRLRAEPGDAACDAY